MAGVAMTTTDGVYKGKWWEYTAALNAIYQQRSITDAQTETVKNLFAVTQQYDYPLFSVGGVSSLGLMKAVGELQPAETANRDPMPEAKVATQLFKTKQVLSEEWFKNKELKKLEKAVTDMNDVYWETRQRVAEEFYVQAILGNLSFYMASAKFMGATIARDGVCQFSANHVAALEPTLTQSNLFTNGITAGGVAAVAAAMSNFLNEDGTPIGVEPDTILFCNDAQSRANVYSVVGTPVNPDVVQKRFNYLDGAFKPIPLKYAGARLRSLGWTGPLPWVMMDSRLLESAMAAIFVDFAKPELTVYWDDNIDGYCYKLKAAFNATFNMWQYAAVGNAPNGTTLDEPIIAPVSVEIVGGAVTQP